MALSALAVACGGDEPDDRTTPTQPPSSVTPVPASADVTVEEPTPTATRVTTPGSVPPGFEYQGYTIFGDFSFAPAIDFPEDLLMLVATGCTQCDSPPEALYRVWRNDGETHTELLVDAEIAGVEGAYVTSIAISPTLNDIVVTVCIECADGPLSSSSVAVYRSIDGGITWREILRTQPGDVVFARAITDEGIVLEKLGGGLSYLRGDAIEPPPGASGLLHGSDRAGGLLWLGEDKSVVLDSDGVRVAAVEPGSLIDALGVGALDPARTAVGWGVGYVGGPFEGWAVTRPGPDGTLAGFRLDTYIAPVKEFFDGTLLGVFSTEASPFGGSIGFIDASRGILTPIHGALIESPFGDGQAPAGRNDLMGAVQGPFLRVVAAENCVPIRADIRVQSSELTCAADGTLVYDLESTVTIGGQEWSSVRLLDGRRGFAVSSYFTGE